MTWEFEDTRPIYLQLVERLLCRVVTGEYAPGEKIPSVRDLAAEAGVNPNTMQKALGQLEQQELLYSVRTSGRFITENEEKIQQARKAIGMEKISLFLSKMKAFGFERKQVLDLIEEMEAKHHA